MGLPSQKRTKSSKKRRASHFALTSKKVNKCSNCNEPISGHSACKKCGYYKGQKVLKTKSVLDKKSKKSK